MGYEICRGDGSQFYYAIYIRSNSNNNIYQNMDKRNYGIKQVIEGESVSAFFFFFSHHFFVSM